MPGRPDFGRQLSGASDTPKSPTNEEEPAAGRKKFSVIKKCLFTHLL